MDYIDQNNLFCRAKSMLSSLYGVILWSTAMPSSSSMQIRKYQTFVNVVGLKTLINPQKPTLHHHPFIIHSCRKSSSSLSGTSLSKLQPLTYSSPWRPSSSSSLDDLIGAESGVYLNSTGEEGAITMEKHETTSSCQLKLKLGKRSQCKKTDSGKKLYPPAIPSLARTGNLPGHMPWILTRHYSNGRLIITEERLEHHEYFESYRENGHLILKLVPLDDKVKCCHPARYDEEEDEEEEEEEGLEEYSEEEEEEEKIYDEEKSMAASASSVPKSYLMKNESEKHGDLRKCFTYAGGMISDCYISSCNANANAHNKLSDGYNMAQSGSATTLTTFPIHPMTTVV